jgi:hypothetical protein
MRTVALCLALTISLPLISAGQNSETSAAATHKSPAITEYKLNNASRLYNFVIRTRAVQPENLDGYREGPGTILIFKKGESKPLQIIVLKNLFFAVNDKGDPPVNTAPMYDDQGLINVGDFNFDGHEDFAVQTGHSGSYGGPSYSVYLFAPSTGSFQLSKPMSNLIENSLGFFDVDPRRKRLVTFSKSGCCYHETDEYAVKNNHPVAVSRIVEDGRAEPKYVQVSHQTMAGGKWQTTSTERVPEPADDASK